MQQDNEPERGVLDFLTLFWRRKWLILLFLGGALCCAFIFNQLVSPVYRASVSLLLSRPRYNFEFYRTGEPKIETTPLPLQSVEVFESLVKDGNLVSKVQAALQKRDNEFASLRMRDLMNVVRMSMNKDTGILELNFAYSHPQQVTEIANVWSTLLVDQIESLATGELTGIGEFVNAELTAAEKALQRAEEKFRRFEGKSKLEVYQQELSEKVNLIRNLVLKLDTYAILFNTVDEYLARSGAELKEKPGSENELVLANSLFLQNVVAQLSAQDDSSQAIQMDGLEGKTEIGGRGVSYFPQVMRFEQSGPADYSQQVTALYSIKKDISARLTYLTEYNNRLKKEAEIIKTKYSDENIKKIQLRRTVDVAKTTYTVLVQKNEEVKVAAGTQTGTLKIIKAASVPFEPYSPNKKRNIFVAAVVGLVFGIFAALIKEGRNS